MLNLVDSGERTIFDGGAMREIVEGKGRCDLLPLGVINRLLSSYFGEEEVLRHIDDYICHGDPESLYCAIYTFIEKYCVDPYTAILDLAKHYADGAKKYADRNWEKGLPLHSFIDSGVRHYLKFLRGDTDEPHDRAFMWNIVGAIWTASAHPERIDLPFAEHGNPPISNH